MTTHSYTGPWSAIRLSAELAAMLGQFPELGEAIAGGCSSFSRSTSRGFWYPMIHTPEGYAVHWGEGCEAEQFRGPLSCRHSKEETLTTAVQTYQGGNVPARIGFSTEQVEVLKNTICRGATDAELQLFIATCTRTGLDPFMRQIWAIKRNVKVSRGREADRWEEQMAIQVGVDGYRLIAEQTGLYQGMDGPYWSTDGERWEDIPPAEHNPTYARVIIYRKGVERGYVATARWDAYVQVSPLWTKMGPEMLAKCAETLGLRRAFPRSMEGVEVKIEEAEEDVVEGVVLASTPQPALGEPQATAAQSVREDVPAVAPPAELPATNEAPEEPTPSAAPDSAAESTGPSASAPPASPALVAPSDLLTAIEKRHSRDAKMAAIAAMTRIYGHQTVTRLNADDRQDFAALLQVRLEGRSHDDEPTYTASGFYVCGVCGDVMPEPKEGEPEAAPALPI